VVRRHVDVKMHCNYKHCPDPEFLAAFDEVQRIIACPSCGREVFVPEAYRGMP
jgi:ribosomal protein S27E